MGVIPSTFYAAGKTTHSTTAFNIAHSATKSYSIGRDEPFRLRLIGDHHLIVAVASFVEIKRSKVDPCAATYLLVDMETGLLTLVIDDIFGIGYTSLNSRITDVYRIAARFWKLGL